jgi:NTE family protein
VKTASAIGAWLGALRVRGRGVPAAISGSQPPPRIGLALGGGFARGIAHAAVLQVFEANHIPISCIAGVSAGSIVAAAYASGTTPSEIARTGCSMRFADIARWTIGRLGFAGSDRMTAFLRRLLKTYSFEEMRIPVGVVATDLGSGQPVHFRGWGDVLLPVRASCSYPGLFQPVRHQGRLLVDGAMSVEIPALLCRQLGADRVISVHLPAPVEVSPSNVFQVINRCFQVMQSRTEFSWRAHSDLVVAPEVGSIEWDGFACGDKLLAAGEAAALAALPAIRAWLPPPPQGSLPAGAMPDSIPA